MSTLPFLPGYSFDRNSMVGKSHFPRSQIFGLSNNVAVVFDNKLNRADQCDPEQRFSTFPNGEGPPLPAWIAFDKQALCFLAYWQEGISEMPNENYRVHKVKIIFFLEDDSIQVINYPEPVNTGLIPGIVNKNVLLRRHRIRMPPPNDDQFYNLEHIKVGQDLMIYGKVFRITGCGNAFTENFLRKIGRRVEKSSTAPLDPGTEHAKKARESELMPLRPSVKTYKFRKFLEHDGQVLRFYAFWDDTESLYGDVRDLVILYFLADDTVEIREKIYPNSGQDAFPVLIRRRKLPKITSLPPSVPEKREDYTLLNVLGTPGHGQYYMQDALQAGVFREPEFYKDSDLMIGSIINALGRKVVIYDCDEFTKNYYRSKYSIDDFRPLVPQKRITVKKEILPREIPPHNGFGSEEDSLQNVYALVPKPPPVNFSKFIHLDRSKDESNIFRFAARFSKINYLNKDRKFVINVFLRDETIYVFEVSQRNSGYAGGKFIERMKIKKPIIPNPPVDKVHSEYYKPWDFYIGAFVTLNGFNFVILNADEYCLKYMEDHPDQFPQSNVKLILDKIYQVIKNKLHDFKDSFVKFDPTEMKKIDFKSFKFVLREILGKDFLSEHEIITLGRHYSRALMFDLFSLECLTSLAQRELHRQGFEDFHKLLLLFKHYDKHTKGVLDRKDLYRCLRSYPLPLQPKLMQTLVEKLEPSEDTELNYETLVNALNFKKCPSTYKLPPYVVFDTVRLESEPETDPAPHLVEYKEFLHDVTKSDSEE